MIEDRWIRHQHALAQAAGFGLVAIAALYFGTGGALIWLASPNGAYYDAQPVPEWYFEFFGEISSVVAVLTFPLLIALGLASGVTAWATLARALRQQLVIVRRSIWVLAVVTQIALWLMW